MALAASVLFLSAVTSLTPTALAPEPLPPLKGTSRFSIPAANTTGEDFEALVQEFAGSNLSATSGVPGDTPVSGADRSSERAGTKETARRFSGKALPDDKDSANSTSASARDTGEIQIWDKPPLLTKEGMFVFQLGFVPRTPAQRGDSAQEDRQEQADGAAVPAPVFSNLLPFQETVPQLPKLQTAIALTAEDLPPALTIPELDTLPRRPKAAIALELNLKPRYLNLDAREPAPLVASDDETIGAASAPAQPNKEPGAAGSPVPRISQKRDADNMQGVKPADTKAETTTAETTTDSHPQSKPAAVQKDEQPTRERSADTDRGSSLPAAQHAAELDVKNAPAGALAAAASNTARRPEAAPAERSPLAAPETPAPPAPRTEPARDISFRIPSATHPVDIRLVDRAGQIHVAVRSADPALTKSLQTNVSELAGKLERSGFHTETFVPDRMQPARESQANSNFQDPQQNRKAPQQEPPRPRKPSRSNGVNFATSMLQNTPGE